MDLAGFVAVRPEFAGTDPTVVADALAEAARTMGTEAWGPFGTTSLPSTIADDGQKWLTGDLLSQQPMGQATRLDPNKGKTTYRVQYERLLETIVFPFAVAGGGVIPGRGFF